MTIIADYQSKVITVQEALAKIKSHDIIVTGMASAEPRAFLSELHTIADRVHDITVTTCLPMLDAEYYLSPKHKDAFRMDSWFYNSPMRKAHTNGNISFIPNHLHLASRKRLVHSRPQVYIGNATPPDRHGYCSLSLSNVYEKRMAAAADLVILEINPKLPRTLGDLEIHVQDVDYLIEVDYDIPELPDVAPNQKDQAIGRTIASMIEDGACIQLGIGGIPNAVAAALIDKSDLGVHTEMFTTGMMRLMLAGVITNRRKTLHPGKAVCCFALGTRELYDFIDNHPAVMVLDGSWVNDPAVIERNDNQVSINTTLEIDLTGQCCSESLGPVQFSGTGGQSDTAIGAQRAKNGRSFIALYSTALVTNAETGQKEEVSKIVAMLKPGAAVSLSRNDVDYVVTEYGLVALRGTSIRERSELLIGIAHPKFREELRQQARALGYLPKVGE